MKLTSKELKKTTDQYEIEVTVDYAELDPFLKTSYEELSRNIKIPGFRPGKAPKQKIEEQLGSKIITDAVGRLLPLAAFEIVDAKKYDPVTQPEYSLKKIDEKDGIVFVFSFINRPEVEIGDLSKIKVKKEEPKITQKDIDGVIRSAINGSVKPERIRELAGIKSPAKSEKKEKSDTKDEKDELESLGEYKLNDELVKELDFEKEKTLEALRKTVETRLTDVRKQQIDNEFADKVVEEALKVSKIEVPKYYIQQEKKYQEDQFMERLKEINLDADTYLATQGSSLEEKRKEWAKEAEKRHKIDLLLINLASKEGIATDADVAEEIDKISDPETKEKYQSERSREYIRTVLTRQRGLDKLMSMVTIEGGAKKPVAKTTKKKVAKK